MLESLPPNLKSQIQSWRYESILKHSLFFKNPGQVCSDPLISSIMRYVNYEVIMAEEIIIVAGIK